MRVDRNLNLVLEVTNDDGSVTFVHSMPLGTDAFERYHMVIAKTFAAIYGEGLGPVAGPRVAKMIMRDVATTMGMWEGATGAENGLINEIRRLSSVALPVDGGWRTMLLQEAIDQRAFSEEDASEVENALCFFTVVSLMHQRNERRGVLEVVCKLWNAQIVSSNSTEFFASLPTSIPEGDSTQKVLQSSIPG